MDRLKSVGRNKILGILTICWFKWLFLFHFGGSTYNTIEVFYRGYSHWSMYVLGAICFMTLSPINKKFPWEMPIWLQMIIGSLWITLLELIVGVIVNLWWGLGVWDYSDLPYNLWGQIVPHFTFFWFWLALVGIALFDYIDFWFFEGDKPKYYLWWPKK